MFREHFIKLVIVGAGGFAREVQDVVRACNNYMPTYNLLGFIDDFAVIGTPLNESKVIGNFDWFNSNAADDVKVVIGVGAPEVRSKLAKRIEALGIAFETLIHPNTTHSPHVEFGEGVVVCPGTVITNNIKIGNHVHLNLNSTVGHDAILEDFVTTAPGVHINGNNLIKEGAYFGTGANLVEKITVGEWSIIGAGAAVVSDIPSNVTAVGCPAKVIKTREKGWHNE